MLLQIKYDYWSHKFNCGPSLITNQSSLYTYGIPPTKSHLVKFPAGRNQYFPKPNNLYNLETNVVPNTEATGYHQQTLATDGYKNRMWQPPSSQFDGYPRDNTTVPERIYIGLQDIPSITAAKDTTEYQQAQIFIELECHLELQTRYGTFTHGTATKPYHELIYGTNDEWGSLDKCGQGYIYGKQFIEQSYLYFITYLLNKATNVIGFKYFVAKG
jgi:hypothetical protein